MTHRSDQSDCTAFQPVVAPVSTELRIGLVRDECVFYEGSEAQIREEGVVPSGFEFPLGATSKRWEANGFEFVLRRVRPEGHKGPKRSWFELDHWFVRVEVAGRDYHWRIRRKLEREAEDLKAELCRRRAADSQDSLSNFVRYQTAMQDRAFKTFKSKIPGLTVQKRRSGSKAMPHQVDQGGGQ